MMLIQPVQCSPEWYNFVAKTAIKDQQVLTLAQDYIAAMNKLNERLVQLASAEPQFKSIQFHAAGSNAALPPNLLNSVKVFHQSHGVTLTDNDIKDDIAKNSIGVVSV
jgi:hypothetical protein